MVAAYFPLVLPESLIEIRHLRALCAVDETGRVSLAAESLQISQPAMSRTLQGLEKILGEPVLDRSTRPVTITPLGRRIIAMAGPLLDGLARIATAADEADTDVLRLGVMLSAGWSNLVNVMDPEGAVAGMPVAITPFGLEDGFDDLRAGYIDAAIAYLPIVVPSEFSSHELSRGPASIAIPATHPAAAGRQCSMAAIGRGPLFVPRHHAEWSVNFEALLRARGLEPPSFIDVVNLFEAAERIARGEGVAVSAQANDFPHHPGVAVLTLTDFEIVRQGVLWRAGPMPAPVGQLLAAISAAKAPIVT